MHRQLVQLLIIWGIAVSLHAQEITDSRHISMGSVIPDESYSDQPYIVKADDGAWLCVITTGVGHEGASGQHIVTQRSLDQGKTWGDWVDVEPADGPEASYAVLLKAPSGRVFVFYNHNTDNTRFVLGDNPPYRDGQVKRVDSQGYFVFKYSDDHGKTWSKDRFTIPVREFEIDRNNVYQGKIRFFWNVGKAFNYKGSAYVPLIKVGGFGDGFFTSNEGVLLQSPNLFTVQNPAKAKWNTLPDGDVGLKTPPGGGPIAAEQSFTELSDGSLFCVYRTIDGYPACTYSRDGGHTWETPHYMKYDNGRLVKHPRAANFVWKCENGKYLYWYHNHGGRFIKEHPNRRNMAYDDRNPVWLSGGVEADTPGGKIIRWAQPEISLYDDDPLIRMSYPDLIEDKGNYYISETQKDIARVHQVDETLLKGLWGQFDNKDKATAGLQMNWLNNSSLFPQSVKCPSLSKFYIRNNNSMDQRGFMTRQGYTIEIDFTLEDLSPDQVLLDARAESGQGWYVKTTENKTLEINLSDGQTKVVWNCDEGLLKPGKRHFVNIVVDAGPHIILFIVDGFLNDGGYTRQFGWGRFSPYFKMSEGSRELLIGPKLNGVIHQVNIYDRALRVSEAVGNYNSAKHSWTPSEASSKIEKEWSRTNPDIIVYLPDGKEDGDNEHFLVFDAPHSKELLAIWTQSSVEGRGDNRAVIARSKDGKNWDPPVIITGKASGRTGGQASWAFPVVSKKGRIYCFFTKEALNPDTKQHSGVLGCFYSDDNGHTWIEGKDISVPKNKYDNPDPAYTPNWIVWQKPIRDGGGRYVGGYTQWTSETVVKRPDAQGWVNQDSRSYFVRFENIDDNPLPENLIITWLPKKRKGIEVPHRDYPISVAQEPAVVLLPDKRLFTVMRTMTGYIWYSVSDDNGETWRKPEVLRYKDGGEMIKNPMASCPIYSLSENRFLLIHYNNAGQKGEYNQFKKVWDNGNQSDFLRNPASVCLGKFMPKAHQPIWFSQSKEFLSTDDIPVGPKGTAEVATYPSITEKNGEFTLWYPDRKHFLLGKYLSKSLLQELESMF
ncbi:MAG: exo-alpha-sialidase [Prevotella sp.]|jgi:hypothetical protein|nr:exo-alpha-sialidase [Prevotella sp.]